MTPSQTSTLADVVILAAGDSTRHALQDPQGAPSVGRPASDRIQRAPGRGTVT
ncbi:MAG: hypothetical protein V9H69_11890 [Anaerolineae bacterium]